mgnify:CR=1 FL=1
MSDYPVQYKMAFKQTKKRNFLSRQCAVSASIRIYYFWMCYFSFLYIVNLKCLCVSEMLENLPHAHRISLLPPAPVSHIFHSCRPSMPQTQRAALVPTPIKQSHESMVSSYRLQTLHDTIHTVLPGKVLPAISSYSEPSRSLFATYIPLRQKKWFLIF